MTASPRQRHPRVDDPMVDLPADVRQMENRTQFVIEPGAVRRKWQELEESVTSVIAIDSAAREEQRFPLAPLFCRLSGTSVAPAGGLFASCRGNYRCALYVDDGVKRHPFLEALKVEPSVHGFVEAVYLALHLPVRFLSWRATCGRDYALLIDEKVDWTYYPQGRALRDVMERVERPVGIRVCNRRDRYYVSCLMAYTSGWIVDRVVRIAAGSVSVLPAPDVVWEPPIKMIY